MEKSERIQVGISVLDHFILSSEDEAISIFSCAENARGQWGCSRFAVVESSQSIDVAEARRAAEAAGNNRMRF